jgi:AcrR family transcriptional regulator
MPKLDRRILKSQQALKKAVIELMDEKSFDDITIQDLADRANVSRGTIYLHYMDKYDLLDKLIESHIDELRAICVSAADMDFIDSTLLCTEYLDSNYSFFSTMIASKGAPYFQNRYLNFLIEEFRNEVDVTKGINQGLDEDVIVRFVASAYEGIVEWWLRNEKPLPHEVLAKQLGELLERNL